MKKLRIMQKFWLLSVVLIIILILQISTIFINNRAIHSNVLQVGNQQFPLLDKAHRLKLSVVQVQQWLTDISATRGRDGLNDGFDEAEQNALLFLQLIDELQAIDPDNHSRYQAMIPSFQAYYDVGKLMAQRYMDTGPEGGNKIMARFDEAAATLALQVDTFVADVQASSTAMTHTSTEVIQRANTITMTLSAILFVVVTLVIMLFMGIMKCIPKINLALANIAHGNLNGQDLNLKRNDEIGEVADNIVTMKHKLHQILTSMSDVVHKLRNSAHTYTSHVEHTLEGMMQQRSGLDQIATAVNEMSSTSQEMAGHAQHTKAATEQTAKQTHASDNVVDHSCTKINNVAGEVDQGVAAINDLHEQSEQIGAILNVIDDIAEQTNLLALNAAIEAARAGDQGRGFAVVADEVRQLAQRTQKSTHQIQPMIANLQTSATNATQVITNSRAQAMESVEMIGRVKESMVAISSSVQNIDNMSLEIAAATSQQSQATEDISRNIVSIYDVCQHTTQETEELNKASHELDQLADDLSHLVERFKV